MCPLGLIALSCRVQWSSSFLSSYWLKLAILVFLAILVRHFQHTQIKSLTEKQCKVRLGFYVIGGFQKHVGNHFQSYLSLLIYENGGLSQIFEFTVCWQRIDLRNVDWVQWWTWVSGSVDVSRTVPRNIVIAFLLTANCTFEFCTIL